MLAAPLPVVVWLYIRPWGKVGLGVGLEALTFHECFHVHSPGHIHQGTGGTFRREEDVKCSTWCGSIWTPFHYNSYLLVVSGDTAGTNPSGMSSCVLVTFYVWFCTLYTFMITGVHVSSIIQSIVKVTFDFCVGLTPKMIENRVL